MFFIVIWALVGMIAVIFSETINGAIQGIGILLIGFLCLFLVALEEMVAAIDRNTEATLQNKEKSSEK